MSTWKGKRVSEMSDDEIREMCERPDERQCMRVGLHNCSGEWRNHDRVELTGPEFAALFLIGHTQTAHIDERACDEPTCVSIHLLRDRPDTWRSMTLDDVRAWLAERSTP